MTTPKIRRRMEGSNGEAKRRMPMAARRRPKGSRLAMRRSGSTALAASRACHLAFSEAQAHRYIEKQAMDMRATKRAIAEEILKTYES